MSQSQIRGPRFRSTLPVLLGVLGSLAPSLIPSSAFGTQTISAQRIAATNRLLPLTKITVGPDDQYDASVDSQGRFLVFTHKAALIANLQAQDLKSGDVVDLLPLNADSQAATLTPNGEIAFTYYKFNARGDVCHAKPDSSPLKPLADSDIHCVERSADSRDTQRSNPFWKSANEIGFLERDVASSASRIVIQNVKTGARQVVAEGRLWSPAMRFGGRYLAYNELTLENGLSVRHLTLLELATGRKGVARFALPGISGFPSFSDDETHLIFTHYLNDTNNDRAIDGGDNAVVFRVPIARVFGAGPKEELIPEQLTSAETSCSFPRPRATEIYLTCAFEGSLDIYRMPASGVVPADWDTARITNALQTSRSYQDRILLLNALRLRGSLDARTIEDRLLSNHIFADDTVAARFYLNRLARNAKPADRPFYDLLSLSLTARELKKSQPSDAISREFQQQILDLDKLAAKVSSEARFRSIVRGQMNLFISRTREAESYLRQVRFSIPVRPLERYAYFELASQIYSPGLPHTLPALAGVYKQMLAAPDLSEESRVYYAFSLLKTLAEVESSPQKRIDFITKVDSGLAPAISSLLKSETVVLRMIMAKDEAAKATIYRELDTLMNQTKAQYFVRKALYVRAITNLAAAADFKNLNLVANNWLRYTTATDTEFIHAREVVANVGLDRGYESLAKGNLEFAGNFFYGSLSLTDDLESHAGYVRTMLLKNQRKTVDERYENLRKRQFIDDNMKFVEALLAVIEGDPKTPSADRGRLDDAIEKLQEMTQDRDSPIRYLLLGYCYLQKLLGSASGMDFDAELFQQAHRSLMLAYDLGRDNARIRASALMNLGILHQRVQNQGLAVRFFTLRKKLGFVSDDERARFAWLYAKSLGRNFQADRAADELAEVPAAVRTTPHLERQAFYSMVGGKYAEAATLYAQLFKSGQLTSDENLAKAHLDYGFSLFKTNKPADAQKELNQALAIAGGLNKQKKGPNRALDFDPDRIKFIAYGLLSQLGVAAERAKALENRIQLLAANHDLVDDWQAAQIRNHLRLAELTSATDIARAVGNMNAALKLAEGYSDANQFLSMTVFRTLSNYMAHGLAHRSAYQTTNTGLIRGLVEKTIAVYDQQKIQQSMLDYQKLKLQVLWAVFATKVLGTPEPASRNLESILASATYRSLAESMPLQATEIQALATAVGKAN